MLPPSPSASETESDKTLGDLAALKEATCAPDELGITHLSYATTADADEAQRGPNHPTEQEIKDEQEDWEVRYGPGDVEDPLVSRPSTFPLWPARLGKTQRAGRLGCSMLT